MTDSPFSIDNLPFGIFSTESNPAPRAGTAYGQDVIDLSELDKQEVFNDISDFQITVFDQPYLNDFASLPSHTRSQVRDKIQSLIRSGRELPTTPLSAATMHLPMKIGGFVDFLTSKDHSERAGRAFGMTGPLNLNFFHLPTAYNGRASSVVVSGTNIRRPWVQSTPTSGTTPQWTPSQALDFELEMGCFVCKDSKLFDPVKMDDIDEYIFGYALVNDWSARDVQRWESTPLGPFLGKSFATSVSPWIITPDALAVAATSQVPHEYQVLPYLEPVTDTPMFDIHLSISVRDKFGKKAELATSNFKYMYFSFQQMLVSQTSNGCNIRCGDLIASGTISGRDETEFGCLLEATKAGRQAFSKDGLERKYLEDYDEVIFDAWVDTGTVRFGFGQLTGTILPAHPE